MMTTPATAAGSISPRFRSFTQRVRVVDPPAHDLTDFWKGGGNLRAWVAGHVAEALEDALAQVDHRLSNPTVEHWRRVFPGQARDRFLLTLISLLPVFTANGPEKPARSRSVVKGVFALDISEHRANLSGSLAGKAVQKLSHVMAAWCKSEW